MPSLKRAKSQNIWSQGNSLNGSDSSRTENRRIRKANEILFCGYRHEPETGI